MADRFWVNGTGVWSDATNHWTTSSGGSPGAGNFPTSSDDVFIDTLSGFGSGGTITLDGAYNSAVCKNFTSTTGASYVIEYSSSDLDVYGSMVLESGLTFSDPAGTYINFLGTGNFTITVNSAAICVANFDNAGGTWTVLDDLETTNDLYVNAGSVTFDGSLTVGRDFEMEAGTVNTLGVTSIADDFTFTSGTITTSNTFSCAYLFMNGGTMTLGGNLTVTVYFDISGGTFDANDYNVSSKEIEFWASDANIVVWMGSGTWELSGNYPFWFVQDTTGYSIAIHSETSTIKFIPTGTTYSTFQDDDVGVEEHHIYYNLWFTGAGTGTIYLGGSNTFNNLTIDSYHTVYFDDSHTVTILGTFSASGIAGHLTVLTSWDDWNISKASGIVNCDYVDISYSQAIGGATWKAGLNSYDSGDNSGWIFYGQHFSETLVLNEAINIPIILLEIIRLSEKPLRWLDSFIRTCETDVYFLSSGNNTLSFYNVQSEEIRKSAGVIDLPMPTMDSDQKIVMDLLGASREIKIEGIVTSQDVPYLYQYVKDLVGLNSGDNKTLVNGNQPVYGYHSVMLKKCISVAVTDVSIKADAGNTEALHYEVTMIEQSPMPYNDDCECAP